MGQSALNHTTVRKWQERLELMDLAVLVDWS